jgi:pimeloyl-ACP methyl ester carboxylesterase
VLGHSLGGKIASVVAARALAGELPPPAGVVLLAASPPVPEPRAEERRELMLSWVEDGPLDASAASEFIAANVGGPLELAAAERAVTDLLRTSPTAWRDWLESGSREDVSGRVGVLDLPALILAGGADGDLGEDAQRELNGAVYPRATFVTLPGAGHLLPLERPREVAAAIRASRPART